MELRITLNVQISISIRSMLTEEATKGGLMKVFNMIVLGGFLKLKPIIAPEFIHKGLEKSLPKRHHGMIPANEKSY